MDDTANEETNETDELPVLGREEASGQCGDAEIAAQ
jgi:hypothetical protein